MERASGVIILNDPETNYPIAVMEASLISSMRTAAVSVIAAKHLAKKGFKDLTIIGCGLIGDKQLQSMLEQFDHIERVLFTINSLKHVHALLIDGNNSVRKLILLRQKMLKKQYQMVK